MLTTYYLKLSDPSQTINYKLPGEVNKEFAETLNSLVRGTLSKMNSTRFNSDQACEIISEEYFDYIQSLHNLLHDMLADPNLPIEWKTDIKATLR